MNENVNSQIMSDDCKEYISDLLRKANSVNEKTRSSANVSITVDGVSCPVRVDDHQLLFIGCRLLPNMVNYLVNILPQFLYPYVVAYLQELSSEDQVITINQLYEHLNSVNE